MGCKENFDTVNKDSAVFNHGLICQVFKPLSAVACSVNITNNDANTVATNRNVNIDQGKICSF